MAHGPSHQPLPATLPPGHHPSAEDEYLVQPPTAEHEHSDANVWIIVKFGLWLGVSAIVIHIGLGFLFGLFVKQSEETNPQFPLAIGQEQRLPAAPRLQQFPVNEFVAFRKHEQAVLEEYGWVSKEAGVVRIPIDEAMRRAVASGLPARAGQTETPSLPPGMMPADSSAGRTLERRRQ